MKIPQFWEFEIPKQVMPLIWALAFAFCCSGCLCLALTVATFVNIFGH